MLTKQQTEQQTSKFLSEENGLNNVFEILKPSHQDQKNDIHDQPDRTV